jgi:kynurenine formamidase
MDTARETVGLAALLKDAPTNWGRWGDDDELGGLNLLDAQQVLRGAQAVRQGRVVTLQRRIGDAVDELMHPSRKPAQHTITQDRQSYRNGSAETFPGGLQFADDTLTMYLQSTTHVDGLGHAWFDDTIYNGRCADTTIGGMRHAGALPLAERGIVGHGVLIDIAAHRGKDTLEPGEVLDHHDILDCAESQGIALAPRDILVIRTGWPRYCAQAGPDVLTDLNEPGLCYSPELVDWFQSMEIPVLVTDTIGNEATHAPGGSVFALHAALMRNLGVVFTELAALEELAADCARDGQYTFLYAASPLKVTAATGAPVNPLAIK